MRTFNCVVVCLICVSIAEGLKTRNEKELIDKLEQWLSGKDATKKEDEYQKNDFNGNLNQLLTRKGASNGDNLARGKPTYQTSTRHTGVASRAVDGDTNSDFGDKSCTHTSGGGRQYWYVDLEAEYSISEVVIYNRMDCCSDRLQDTEVYIVPITPTSWTMESQYLCGKIKTSTQNVTQIALQCRGLRGQFVVIRKTNTNPLSLCEVEVFKQKNLAEEKPTYQTSTRHTGVASRAVDGDTNSDFGDKSCTHTSGENQQYWYVDLEAEYSISEVVIHNRMDCCSDRLQGTEVYIVPKTPTSWTMESQYLCGEIVTSTENVEQIALQCGGLRGRFVVIRKTNTNPLSLCEVEVFKQQDLARGKPTYQTSTRHTGVASRAVDGDTNSDFVDKSCTHTSSENQQYWYVDLEAEYSISEVVIYNRMDCCSYRLQGTEVYIVPKTPTSWTIESQYLCGEIKTSTENVKRIALQCDGLRGQFVVIRKTNTNPLSLCEVEVF